MESILIVDDNKDLQFLLSGILTKKGYKTIIANNGFEAIKLVNKSIPNLVLLDLKLPEMDGIEVLQELMKIDKELLVIMITAYGDVSHSVKAMKLGAYDYITKPLDYEEIIITIRKALKTQDLTREVEVLRRKLYENTGTDKEMGDSPKIKKVLHQLDLIADTNLSVIIQGDSGTGKEVIANIIHHKSSRKNKPFIAVDCGAIPETLVESELFGYEKGAFTGANTTKKGKFEEANNGTLLLDEITNLPLDSQAKLLRAIESGEIYRVGGKKAIKIDARIISTTNLDMINYVNQEKFRKDLYHRLNQFKILLPSLTDRKEDIPLLANEFLKEANIELNKSITGFSPDAMKLLVNYSWPGNVRELKNIVKKAVILTDSGKIKTNMIYLDDAFPVDDQLSPKKLEDGVSMQDVINDLIKKTEKDLIVKTLKQEKYNKTKTAKLLGIDRKTLYTKIKNFGI
ncbi:MAG: sigma-54-dependent Fis family transcriptional regulator [Candidatus Cloacimonetes bacterium]|nr:sigma-54-dependent Fis family transcriptional regulator [Candidatus Cloacimonadota bacterium]